jgi:hypothetical protein
MCPNSKQTPAFSTEDRKAGDITEVMAPDLNPVHDLFNANAKARPCGIVDETSVVGWWIDRRRRKMKMFLMSSLFFTNHHPG